MSKKEKPKMTFFDDREVPGGELVKGLSKSFDLELVSPPPLDQLIKLHFTSDKIPDAFLTDYRLSYGKLSNGANLYYSGKMLLFALREAIERKVRDKVISLIAISQYRYFTKKEEKEDLMDIKEIADYIIYKEDYLKNPELTNKKISSIIHDLPQLYEIDQEKKSWQTLVNLFKPPDTKYVSELLLNSNHPLSASQIPLYERIPEEETTKLDSSKAPSHPSRASWTSRDATKWIVYTLFEYPGVLWDSLHASTFLGLDRLSFETSKWLRTTFESAKYIGIFHGIEDFWWKYKMEEIVENIMIENNLDDPIARNFIKACPPNEGIKPNKGVYSGETGADKVCYFLKMPVHEEYALKYLADDRPLTMEPAYVSRTAYETSDEIVEELISSSDREKLKEWYKKKE
ncbi:MAG: hypothetical protein ACFFER_10470 [Candidatus Thorarchaeota archaeon]